MPLPQPETTIEPKSHDDFVGQLQQLVGEGFGIVPFLGSGCSSASGILMGQEFTDYLGYVVYRCVCQTGSTAKGNFAYQEESRWDISRKGWPDRPNEDQIVLARRWCREVFNSLSREHGLRPIFDINDRVQTLMQENPTSSPSVLAKLLIAPTVPAFLRGPDFKDENDAIRAIHEALGSRYASNEKILRSSKSPTSYAAICEKAVRSLIDWRATLQFLATLRYSPKTNLLSTEEPDTSIIDRFNVHITKNKKPNLTHVMLAQLAMSARIRVTLTTNFDSLLEAAFEAFGRQLAVIPVGVHDVLPHPDLVHERDSLVKLHGDCHDTRADYTLDDPASPEDKLRFFNYVRGNFPDFELDRSDDRRFIPSQLLVVGYSGSDRRCNEMLKYVLDSDTKAKLFWICHSQRDFDNLQRRFSETDYARGRIVATVTERPDLLLYDFYQKLNLTLPSAGPTYQFPDRVIPARSPLPRDKGFDDAIRDANLLAEELMRPAKDAKGQPRGPVVIAEGDSGILTVIHQSFEVLGKQGRQRIWLELEDFPNPAVAGAEIRTALSVRTGALPLGHMKPLPAAIRMKSQNRAGKMDKKARMQETIAWQQFFEESCKELGISSRMWVIGFYARNGPGGCSGWEEAKYWTNEHYEDFRCLLEGLSLAGFCLLYAPYTERRRMRDEHRQKTILTYIPTSKQAEAVANLKRHFAIRVDEAYKELAPAADPGKPEEAGDFFRKFTSTYKQPPERHFDAILKEVWNDVLCPALRHPPAEADNEWRRSVTALYSATLFRQSRHFSAFLNDGLFRCPQRFNLISFDNDEDRVAAVRKWLDLLAEKGMFYMKPGGFAWAYRDTRLGLRQVIEWLHLHSLNTSGSSDSSKGGRPLMDVAAFRARNHFHIAEWYAQAHQVTGHPMPMMEALHHFYQAAKHAGSATGQHGLPDKVSRELSIYRVRWFYSALLALHQTLRRGAKSMRYWASAPAIHFLCDGFGDDERKALKDSMNQACEGFAADKREFLKRGEALIDSIEAELSQIKGRIGKDYRIHRYPVFASSKKSTDAPTPNVNSLGMDWKSSGSKNKAIPLVVRKIIGIVSKASSVDTTGIWAEVGKLEIEFLGENGKGRSALLNPGVVHDAVQYLVEWGFVFVRRAKRLSRVRKLAKDNLSARQCWLTTSILCSVALDLCRLLPAGMEDFSAKERAKALSLYGLSLGYLGRFHEAHRRIGEARAIIRAMRRESRHVLLGIAELRRAEVLCLEAAECSAILELLPTGCKTPEERKINGVSFILRLSEDTLDRSVYGLSFSREEAEKERKEKRLEDPGLRQEYMERAKNVLHRRDIRTVAASDEELLLELPAAKDGGDPVEGIRERISRIRQAKIGDAWRCLEEARRSFSGRTHSQRWWGRLYSLELRVFGEAGDAIRSCGGPESETGSRQERFRMLLCRSRRDTAAYLKKLWKQGLAVAGDGSDLDKGGEAGYDYNDERYVRFRVTALYLFALMLGDAGFDDHGHSGNVPLSVNEMREGIRDIQDFIHEDEKAHSETAQASRRPVNDLTGCFINRFKEDFIEVAEKHIKGKTSQGTTSPVPV